MKSQTTAVLVCFILGVICHRFLSQLISLEISLVAMTILGFLAFFYRDWHGWRPILTFSFGLLWANFNANQLLQQQLDPMLVKQDVIVIGSVTDIPIQFSRYTRFDFKVESLSYQGLRYSAPAKIRLKDYQSNQAYHSGQRWQLVVRLKQPHGLKNPGALFDYEQYLFANGIRATGYVRDDPNTRLISLPDNGHFFARLRQEVKTFINTHFPQSDNTSVLIALLVGIKTDISESQWQLFRDTGTTHLMAISGLHIGLVCMIMVALVRLGFRILSKIYAIKSNWYLTLAVGVFAAFIYAMLAGLTIPTRRAFVTLCLVVLVSILKRKANPSQVLLLVLAGILLSDPLATLSSGFWLSFFAVSLIVLIAWSVGLQATGNNISIIQKIKKTIHFQLAISIGMIPLVLLLFNQISLISPLANLIAIPVVGLLVVPIGLMGLVFFILDGSSMALICFKFALNLIHWLIEVLRYFATIPFSSIQSISYPAGLIGLFFLAMLMVLAKRAVPGRWVAVIGLFSLMWYQPKKPDMGHFTFTLLDVGHGLSSVVQTNQHVLVFDTGPAYTGSFNTGKSVLQPFLQSRGIHYIDKLFISHEHNDHAGGYRHIKNQYDIGEIYSGNPSKIVNSQLCQSDQKWLWDEVMFEVLWPVIKSDAPGFSSGNNASCVIRVSSDGGSVLLTADIEKPVERYLNKSLGATLKSDVLQVPHQGSYTSSTMEFIDNVKPSQAIFSIGYANQFNHPHETVVTRYRQREINQIRTDQSGAITVQVTDRIKITQHRDSLAGYWYSPIP